MTESREKAIKRTKNLAYWFMGEMLKRGERKFKSFNMQRGTQRGKHRAFKIQRNGNIFQSQCRKETEKNSSPVAPGH